MRRGGRLHYGSEGLRRSRKLGRWVMHQTPLRSPSLPCRRPSTPSRTLWPPCRGRKACMRGGRMRGFWPIFKGLRILQTAPSGCSTSGARDEPAHQDHPESPAPLGDLHATPHPRRSTARRPRPTHTMDRPGRAGRGGRTSPHGLDARAPVAVVVPAPGAYAGGGRVLVIRGFCFGFDPRVPTW